MNLPIGLVALLILFVCVLSCDSPPPAQCVLVNETQSEIVIKITTTHMLLPVCVYSADDWAAKRGCKPFILRAGFNLDHEEKLSEVPVLAGGAVRLSSAKYPTIEEDVEHNFLIDRLEINGSAGEISWSGRVEIFSHFKKEGGGPLWYVFGNVPRYVYYYK